MWSRHRHGDLTYHPCTNNEYGLGLQTREYSEAKIFIGNTSAAYLQEWWVEWGVVMFWRKQYELCLGEPQSYEASHILGEPYWTVTANTEAYQLRTVTANRQAYQLRTVTANRQAYQLRTVRFLSSSLPEPARGSGTSPLLVSSAPSESKHSKWWVVYF